MPDLEAIRNQIDEIDREMAALFERRMEAAQSVAAYKKENNLSIPDPAREAKVAGKNQAYVHNAKIATYYPGFIACLMRLSREYQAELIGQVAVAYQGAEAGFGHLTATRLFPRGKLFPKATFAGVFDAVEKGECDFGVVPFENSATGDVSGVLDLCYMHSCHITAMYRLKVVQNLLGLPGAALGDIKTVCSHVQALEQSRRFLSALGAQLAPFENTAVAAAQVAQQQDKTIAAVGSLEAGSLYGLVPLAQDISDNSGNATRFIVISKRPAVSGNRFSLLVTVENGVGQLARVIGIIAQHGFNMENIKSRPRPGHPFEYYFYIELVGAPASAETETLLGQLRDVCLSVRLLGVYNSDAGP